MMTVRGFVRTRNGVERVHQIAITEWHAKRVHFVADIGDGVYTVVFTCPGDIAALMKRRYEEKGE